MLAKKTRKILSLALVLVMVISMFPMFAMAEEGDPPSGPIENLKPVDTKDETGKITLSKTAERIGPDEWEVTVVANVGDIIIEQQPLEVCFVLDCSGSMNLCDRADHVDSLKHETHNDTCKTYTCTPHTAHDDGCYNKCTAGSNPDHWVDENAGAGEPSWVHDDDCDKQVEGSNYYLTCGITLDPNHAHNASCTFDCSYGGLVRHGSSSGTCTTYNSSTSKWENLPNRMTAAAGAVTSMAAGLPAMASVMYVKFSTDASSASSTLGPVAADGFTNLMAGVNEAIQNGFSDSTVSQKVLVIVTDGIANRQPADSTGLYSSRWLTNFTGSVFTVGFTHNDSNLSGMIKGTGSYMTANNTSALVSSLETIRAQITAMIVDPMGSWVDADKDSVADKLGSVTGSYSKDIREIRWLPHGDTKITNSTIAYTYKVKLNDVAAMNAGLHDNVSLNAPTYLQYGVKGDNEIVDAKNANFPIPIAKYEVGTLQVKWQSAGTDIKNPTEVESVITDFTEENGYEKAAGFSAPAFALNVYDYGNPPEKIPASGGGYYLYVDSTLTVNSGESAAFDPETGSINTDANAYLVIHNYILVEPGTLTVSKAITGAYSTDTEGISATFQITECPEGFIPADYDLGEDRTFTLNSVNGFSKSFANIPEGRYVITELSATTYPGSNLTTSYVVNGGTVTPGTSASIDIDYYENNVPFVQFTNTYRQDVYPTSYSLTVNHIGVAADGTRTPLRSAVTTTGYSLGQNYTTAVGSFTGWTFLEMDAGSAPANGTINGNTVVTYLYESDTDIPEETDPLGDGVDIPDETDPLGDGIDIPDDLDPLGDAPKTGDGNNVFALLAIMISCAFGLVIINLPRKKRNEA